MENHSDKIKQAIEQIIGKRVDAFLLIASNSDGDDLRVADGKMWPLACQLADVFQKWPDFGALVDEARLNTMGIDNEDFKDAMQSLVKKLGGVRHDD